MDIITLPNGTSPSTIRLDGKFMVRNPQGMTPGLYLFEVENLNADGRRVAIQQIFRLDGPGGYEIIIIQGGQNIDIPIGGEAGEPEWPPGAAPGDVLFVDENEDKVWVPIAAVGLSNDYDDLDNLPFLGTAAEADTADFASAAQGALALTALQPDDVGTAAAADVADFATAAQGLLAETALQAEASDFATAAQGALAETAVQPEDLPIFGSAAEAEVSDFASAAQGALAATAVQPEDLGDLATKDLVGIEDLDIVGTPSGTTYLRGDGSWATVETGDPGAVESLFIDQRITTLHVSEALAAPIFSGPDGSALHDGFDSLTYVDDENATGLDISEAGALKPQAGSVESSAAATATGNFDTVTTFDRSWSVDNSRTVTHIGVFSAQAGSIKVKIARRNSASSYDILVDETHTHGGGGWQDFALGTPYLVPSTGTFHAGSRRNTDVDPVSFRASVSRAVFTPDPVGNGVTPTAEDTNGIVPIRVTYAASDLSVSSTDISASVQPETIRVIARMEDTIGVVLNTDVFVDVSRDGGATFTEAVLVERYTEPSDVRVIDTGDVDVSGQPAGSVMVWRFRTENGATVKLLGAVLWGT